jgi:nitrate reductase gamma subunit
MRAWTALLAVAALLAVVYAGVGLADQRYFFGIVIPYVAIGVFLAGVVYRIIRWSRAPVPFRIPTVCGQQKSLPWMHHDHLESPSGTAGVIGRMMEEVLLFRSLFRNTRLTTTPAQRLVYASDKFLWAGALAFHWCFLIIFLRHLRFFLKPVPGFTLALERVDGFFQLTVPAFLITDAVILAALLYLLGRRLLTPALRYISLPADYFALFLLIAIVSSGIFMRHITRVDLLEAKKLTMGLVTFHPVLPEKIGLTFFVHVFLVSALFVYFPFSKLMHLGGVFLSPTRNLANNNRAHRHVNPWNPEVEVHTYEQWEDEFRDKLKAAGIALERE